ncbi:MAG: N-acetyltransferase [Caldilineaceae bacterium]
MTIDIRPATQADEPVLWEMLFEAAHLRDEGHTSVQAAKDRPELALYVTGWGRTGDLGVIAIDAEYNQPVGAAWVRLLTGENKGYAYVDDATPELAIGVHPAYRGQRVGSAMLAQLFPITKAHYPGICLSTRATNTPAMRLYERMGFRKVEGSDVVNWAGGVSYNMVVRFGEI